MVNDDSWWSFYRVDEDSSGGGDLNRTFRGENPAFILGREVPQNSWDAARKLRVLLNDHGIPFRLEFRYESVAGAKKQRLIEAMKLRELDQQRKLDGAEMRLPEGCVLDHLDDDEPIKLLYITDLGAHGLYGHPLNLARRSVMFRALYYMGGSKKRLADPGAGGSYGFGKGAFIRGSRIRTVFAYSSFRPYAGQVNEDDPVTRRLIGRCWWDGHDVTTPDGEFIEYDGRGQFADLRQATGPNARERRVPFEDGEADALATELGMQVRDPHDDEQLGTTLLLLDPTVSPESLRDSLEMYWWPAIEDSSTNYMSLSVVGYDGVEVAIDPAANQLLRPFITAYRIAIGSEQPNSERSEKIVSGRWEGVGEESLPPGKCVLLVPESLDDEEAEVEAGEQSANTPGLHSTQVALVREPRMVVQYLPFKKKHRVPIKGVFVASPEIDPLLSETEPPLHNYWTTKGDDDIDKNATTVAKRVIEKIRRAVGEFAAEVAPPSAQQAVPMSHFSQLISRHMRTPAVLGPTKSGPRASEPIEFTYSSPAEPIAVGEEVATKAQISLRLDSSAQSDTEEVAVNCDFKILEEESATSGEDWGVTITPVGTASGFYYDVDRGAWIGELSKTKHVEFDILSDSYDRLWTGHVAPVVRPLNQEEGSVVTDE